MPEAAAYMVLSNQHLSKKEQERATRLSLKRRVTFSCLPSPPTRLRKRDRLHLSPRPPINATAGSLT